MPKDLQAPPVWLVANMTRRKKFSGSAIAVGVIALWALAMWNTRYEIGICRFDLSLIYTKQQYWIDVPLGPPTVERHRQTDLSRYLRTQGFAGDNACQAGDLLVAWVGRDPRPYSELFYEVRDEDYGPFVSLWEKFYGRRSDNRDSRLVSWSLKNSQSAAKVWPIVLQEVAQAHVAFPENYHSLDPLIIVLDRMASGGDEQEVMELIDQFDK